MIAVAAAIVLGTASTALAQNRAAWSDPPGSTIQDRSLIEEAGGVAVLTPRGYRAYRPPANPSGFGAYAVAPRGHQGKR
jgi:hypothetical protein